jgi:hypothetical protein
MFGVLAHKTLARAVTYTDEQTFLKLYTVYVRPLLGASCSPLTKGDKEILEKVQRRSVVMVSNLKSKDYESKLVEAGMITLEQRRERRDLTIMYRM